MKRSVLAVIWLALVLVAPSLFTPNIAHAQITSIADAINKSGRQRMLSQRILSTYYQVGKNINTTKSKQQLIDAVNLFESQLTELQEYAKKSSIVQQQQEKNIDLNGALNKVSRLWIPAKKIATEEVQRSRAEELRDLNEALLKASHAVVLQLQSLSGSESGRLVNIAGRQRMLSQRLSSLYILQSWGFNNPEYE
ncbi:MAG: type IV pili methyl-accepting chemotaxis transducer N-terminal domain-containing protein, partial [Gammaproteobacteria bacterium]|nr:type IV pili methyl-accepting chemotaxis transducer N-terminal domain-containing protein [Gammaproteobacteria bacterium]